MSESESEDDVQINFVASPSQKAKWEEYAGEAGFRSLSEFIRTSAEKEMKRDGATGGGGSVPEDLTDRLSEVIEGLNRVESRMHDLDNRVAGIESEVREDPDIKKLASEVFSVLPTREEMVEYAKGNNPLASSAAGGTIDVIAAEVDEEPYRVEEALSKLQQDTHQVQSMVLGEEIQGWIEFHDGDDEIRYYKEA